MLKSTSPSGASFTRASGESTKYPFRFVTAFAQPTSASTSSGSVSRPATIIGSRCTTASIRRRTIPQSAARRARIGA